MKINPVILSSTLFFPLGYAHAENKSTVSEDTIIVSAARNDGHIITAQDIDKYRGSSNSNIFSSMTAIQANNMRNEAGAIDIGIRGLQGEGRVPVFIDGSLQSTHTSRGYQGTSDRTYIDADLISRVAVQKGAAVNASPFASGAIGGVVNIKTLTVDDIVNPGEQSGFLIKLRSYNNNRKPDIPDDYEKQNYYQLTPKPKSRQFNNGSATVAFGFRDEFFDSVIAYSERASGNYYAGKHGFTRYHEPVVTPNHEVVNTSFQSQSFLAKMGLHTNNGQDFEFAYRNHRQQAGEVLAAYWYQNNNDIDFNPLPDGVESMPQWALGSAIVNSYSASYAYKPYDNDLVNLNVGLWLTDANLRQYNGLWGIGVNAQQYLHAYSNDRKGVSIYNESALQRLPLVLRYGVALQDERLKPEQDGIIRFSDIAVTSRNGKRSEKSAFINGELDLSPVTVNIGFNLHGVKITDFQSNESLNYRPKLDMLSELNYHLTPATALFFKASRTYRMPSLYESTVSNEVFSYNPYNRLSPEISLQREIGLKTRQQDLLLPEDKLDLSLSYFRNKVNGFISGGLLDKTPGMSEWRDNFTFINYDKLDLSGFELSANYDAALFYTHVSATLYTDTQVCSHYQAQRANTDNCNSMGFAWGLTPSRIPAKKNLVVNVGKKFMAGDLDTGVRYKYHSAKTNPSDWLIGTGASPIIDIPSGYQIDLYGQYRVNKNATLFATVNNLTNRYDIQPGSVISMPEPGRTVTLGMDVRF